VSLATSMPMNSGSDMVFSQSCEYELAGRVGRRRLIRLFGLVPQGRRGSRSVTASRAWTRPISRRPQLTARLATLASPQAAPAMEPLTMSDVNIQAQRQSVADALVARDRAALPGRSARRGDSRNVQRPQNRPGPTPQKRPKVRPPAWKRRNEALKSRLWHRRCRYCRLRRFEPVRSGREDIGHPAAARVPASPGTGCVGGADSSPWGWTC